MHIHDPVDVVVLLLEVALRNAVPDSTAIPMVGRNARSVKKCQKRMNSQHFQKIDRKIEPKGRIIRNRLRSPIGEKVKGELLQ